MQNFIELILRYVNETRVKVHAYMYDVEPVAKVN